jgi:hypothetical protein
MLEHTATDRQTPTWRLDAEHVWAHVGAAERDRFVTNVYRRRGDECWIWTGALEPDGGYSRFRSDTLGVIAGHRWSLIAHIGALSEPVVRHRCDVRCCVRPDHLIAGTQAQNIADTVRRGRWTSYARTGPRQWPQLAYALRCAARDANDTQIAELLRRPIQLEMWPEH